MDEFHWYADRDRGVAWQVPLLTLPQARFLLMSATLGDVTLLRGGAHPPERPAHGHREVGGAAGAARVRLLRDPAGPDAGEARRRGQGARSTSSTSRRRTPRDSAQDFTSLNLCTREEKNAVAEAIEGFRFTSPYGPDVRKWLQQGIGLHHAGPAAQVPRARRAARPARACSRSSAAPTPSASASTCPSAPCSSPGSASSTARRPPSSPPATSTRSPGARDARASTTSASWWPRPPSTSIENLKLDEKAHGRARRS